MNEFYKFLIRIISIVSCTLLAVLFHKWWIILVALIMTADFKINTGDCEEKKEDE